MARDLGGGGWRPERKGSNWSWIALVVLLIFASVIAGFHYGGQRLLKHQADQNAVDSIAIPTPAEERPKVIEWSARVSSGTQIVYRFVVFPNGLECLTTSARNTTCNWAKFNADRVLEEGGG